MLSKLYFCWFKVGSWWWYVEKFFKRLFVKVVLLVVGILGIRLVVGVRIVVIFLIVGGVLVVFDIVIWMVWVLFFFMDFCLGFIVVVCKVWNSWLCEKLFYEFN